jgi:hypothetical protein
MEAQHLSAHWDVFLESNIKTIAEKCLLGEFTHREMARFHQNRYDRLTMTGLVMAPLSGFLTALSLNIDMSDFPNLLPVVSACTSFGSAVCISVLKMLNLKSVIHDHQRAAAKYQVLASNIRRQLAVTRTHRVPAGEYYEWIGEYFDNLYSESPLVTDHVEQIGLAWAQNHGIHCVVESIAVFVNTRERQSPASKCYNDRTTLDMNRMMRREVTSVELGKVVLHE